MARVLCSCQSVARGDLARFDDDAGPPHFKLTELRQLWEGCRPFEATTWVRAAAPPAGCNTFDELFWFDRTVAFELEDDMG